MNTPFRQVMWGIIGVLTMVAVASESLAQTQAIVRHDHDQGSVTLKLLVPADQQSVQGIVVDVTDYQTDGWLVGQVVLSGQLAPNGIWGRMDLAHVKLSSLGATAPARFTIDDQGFHADLYSSGVMPRHYAWIRLQPNQFTDVNASLTGLWQRRGGGGELIVRIDDAGGTYDQRAVVERATGYPQGLVGSTLFELNRAGMGMYYGRWQAPGSWCVAESASVMRDGTLALNLRGSFGAATEIFDRVQPPPAEGMAKMEGKWVLLPEQANMEVVSRDGQFTATIDLPQGGTVQIVGTYVGDEYSFNWTARYPDGQQLSGSGRATLAANGASLTGQVFMVGDRAGWDFNWRIIQRKIYTQKFY